MSTDLTGDFVYRIWQGGVLMYIGSTGDLGSRFVMHEAMSPFFDAANADIEIAEYDDWDSCLAAERRAIHTEFPRWNIQHRSHLHPDGRLRRLRDIADLYPGTFREELLNRYYAGGAA